MRREDLDLGVLRMEANPTPLGGIVSLSKSSLLTLTGTIASVGAAQFAEQSFTIPGVDPTDRFVIAAGTYAVPGAPCISARCAVAGTLILGFLNPTASPIVPGVSSINAFVIRQGART